MYNFNPYSYNALPVNSIQEAETAPVDYSGNPVFYFNSRENEIYLKRFDMTSGKTLFGKYAFVPATPVEPPKDEFKVINEKLDYLYKLMEGNKLDCHANARNDGTSEDKTTKRKEKAVKDDE